MSTIPISELSLESLFGDSLTASLCVNIEKGTETWVATGMLVQQLESFTDAVVVREKNKPIGIVGGKDIIVSLINNPYSSLFYDTKVEDMMEKRFPTVTKKSKLKEVVNYWKQTRRAFAAIPNEFSDYSALSAKKLLGIGMRVKTEISISQLPKKKLITFDKKDTIGDVLNSMLLNNTRRLFLADSNKFINDRIILQKITDELKYLKEIKNFMDLSTSEFNLEEAKNITHDLTIQEICKIMYKMAHPSVLFKDQIITPWDICLILLSDKITEYEN
ncbi:MAG: CBS domain-containing protein [Nitrosopumilus sp.]|nr:CBS domain-containing protein [Nitrosopumilus sp.]